MHTASQRRHCPTPAPGRRGELAFTLIELLVVIGIMALIAAIAAPSLRRMKETDLMAAANRQLLDDIASARQRAIVGHTTVYMVFMPPMSVGGPPAPLAFDDPPAQKLLSLQQRAYAMFAHRSAGDQPGQGHARYLSDWRTLPEGVFIPTWKFNSATERFQYTTNIPLPTLAGVYMPVPYIAFDYQGRLVLDDLPAGSTEVFIPLARGHVDYPKYANMDVLDWLPARVTEDPVGNSTENTNRIVVDWLTGRTRVVKREITP